MPPERCFGIVVGEVGRGPSAPGSARRSRRGAPAWRALARRRRPNSMLPRTVSHGKTPYSWKITPRSGPGPSTGASSSRTCAARRLDEAADDVHQRRLAAARGADDRDELALADVEADAVDDAHRPGRGREVDADVVEAKANDVAHQADHRQGVERRHRGPQAIRSCQATSRRVAARSARSIASAIRPMQMMPT